MNLHQLALADSLNFILGGHAIFTFKSVVTGKHFTYLVTKATVGKNLFVKGLTGSDNTSDYQYIGYINGKNEFKHTEKSNVSEDAPIVKAFEYSFKKAVLGFATPNLEFYHKGKCCKCGRLLTTPESVASGIGPECKKRRKANK